MSGGSWDYAYSKVLAAADMLAERLDGCSSESEEALLRLRLIEHMTALADVMKAIEWSDSGDTQPNAWVEPTRGFLSKAGIGNG